MSIHRLPDYIINKLKAGEIVERPVSIIKELVENSLDAGATTIVIDIHDGGKWSISVQDNGSGIEVLDMDLVLERYATSKIDTAEDIYSLSSYGFRWEALASIAEISKITLTSKTSFSDIGIQLTKKWDTVVQKPQSVGFTHGTHVLIEDIFYNVPVRQKFLKSSQTEYYYCYNYFLDIALCHIDKHFIFQKSGKVVFDVAPVWSLSERVYQLLKKDWKEHVYEVDHQEDNIVVQGIVGDSTLHFGSAEHMRLYVNHRPIQDKIIKKAIMEAYRRQIVPWEYPFVCLFIHIDPGMVDVNVHPRKLEVKFLEPQKIYDIVYRIISAQLWHQKISTGQFAGSFVSSDTTHHSSYRNSTPSMFTMQDISSGSWFFDQISSSGEQNQTLYNDQLGHYNIVGQIRNMYIVLQSDHWLFFVDQHALAERISFEKMKRDTSTHKLQPEIMLQPLQIDISQQAVVEDKIQSLNLLWFDIQLLSDTKLVVYAVPRIFVDYKIDLERLLQHVLYLDVITYDHILDEIFATRACKTSIKAWEKLSLYQMQQLLQDWFTHIDGMFVCQHGRPFFIQIDKKYIDWLMDR